MPSRENPEGLGVQRHVVNESAVDVENDCAGGKWHQLLQHDKRRPSRIGHLVPATKCADGPGGYVPESSTMSFGTSIEVAWTVVSQISMSTSLTSSRA